MEAFTSANTESSALKGLLTPSPWKRSLFFVCSDGVIILGSTVITYLVATHHVAANKGELILRVLPYAGLAWAFQAVLGFLFSIYHFKWSTFTLSDVPRAAFPAFVTTVLIGILSGTKLFTTLSPWSVLTWGLLNIGGVISVRMSKRFYNEVVRRKLGKRAVLVVSSEKGYFLLDVLHRLQPFYYHIVGFIDPEPKNRGAVVQGVRVLGTFSEIDSIVSRHKIETAFVLLSSNPNYPIAQLLERLYKLGIQVRVIPSFAELFNTGLNNQEEGLASILVHEMTGKPPVLVNPEEMEQVFRDKRILITGAGGSIGSELCRQIAHFNPAELILLERDDSNLFYIEQDLRISFPQLKVSPWLVDITDVSDVNKVFQITRPDIVFHAAAYKHVPILEFHPEKAVWVNVFGTHIVARAAVEHKCESFVYISTDKAVNPTSVMGATKRLGEMLITAMNGMGGVRFMAVRFGNVLASRGSVLTLFLRSIKNRQPIRITHPEMERFFMLTSEAVLLVMQAVAIGKGGEVFVLDMGKPVRIKELAEILIRSAGLQPNVDIPIMVSGIRPGEKIFEELLTAEEGTMATRKERILKAKISRSKTYSELLEELNRFEVLLRNPDPKEIRLELVRQVQTYQPDNSWLEKSPTASGGVEEVLN